jgi:hypothetical protein
VCANPALLGGGGYALKKGTRSHGGQVQSQRFRFFQLGRFDGTCRKAPSTRAAFASTGEQAVNNGRQLSYAEVSAVYAGVVAGRPVKWANAGVDSSATLSTKNGAPGEGKGGWDVKSSRRTPPENKSPTGEKDVTVGTTAGGHLISHPTALNKPSGPPKPTAKSTGSLSVPVASKEAAQRRTSPGATAAVSGPMVDTPTSTTSSSAQVEKVVPPGERRNKTPVYVSGVKNPRSFFNGFARSPRPSLWPR